MGVAESGKSGFRVSAKGPSTMAWDSTCDEWLISEGYCFCGGMGDLKGVIYAAAPAEGEAGWGFIWADPHEQVVLQEDGSEKTGTVNEAEGIAMAATGKKHANGLWIGKQKYQIRQPSGADFNGTERKVVSCGRPKGGAILCATDDCIVIGLYDEGKGQVNGNCIKAVHAFVQYLVDNPQ